MDHSSVTVSLTYVHPTSEGLGRAVARLEALNARNNVPEASLGTELGPLERLARHRTPAFPPAATRYSRKRDCT